MNKVIKNQKRHLVARQQVETDILVLSNVLTQLSAFALSSPVQMLVFTCLQAWNPPQMPHCSVQNIHKLHLAVENKHDEALSGFVALRSALG